MSVLKVACVQMRSGVDVSENCSSLEELVRDAASQGAEYIQTPEMTGMLERKRGNQFAQAQSQENDLTFSIASKLAKEFGIWLHIGSTAIYLSDEKLANRAGLFSPDGNLVAIYDKIHMFDVDLDNGESWRESSVYEPGEISKVVTTDKFMLGMSICYDIRFPGLYREMASAGANILTAPAAFTRQTGRAHWHILQRSRAIENGTFVISAAQGGDHEDGRSTYGHSIVVNPWGEIVAELENDEPGVLVTEIDLAEVEKARQKVPSLKNGRSYRLEKSEH